MGPPPPPADLGAMPADPCDAAPAYRYQEPWTAALFDNARALSLQLVCAGGSGAIAKTAVAPLERVKVCVCLCSAPTPSGAATPMRPSLPARVES